MSFRYCFDFSNFLFLHFTIFTPRKDNTLTAMTEALSPQPEASAQQPQLPSCVIYSAVKRKAEENDQTQIPQDNNTQQANNPNTIPSPATVSDNTNPFNHLLFFQASPKAIKFKTAKRKLSCGFDFFYNPSRKELQYLNRNNRVFDLSNSPPLPVDSDDSDDTTLEDYQYNWSIECVSPFFFISTLPPLPQEFLGRPYVLPKKTRSTPKITLVLDLDETLVHCNFVGMNEPDIVFPLEHDLNVYTIYAKVRPFYKEFIEQVSQKFEVVVFTASTESYATRILNILDPAGKHIKHRLFRDSCVNIRDTYIKDLTILGRDLSKTIIVDNQPQAFGYQVSNGIPIPSFYEDMNDRELLKLLPVLDSLSELSDVREGIASRFGFQEQVNSLSAPMPYPPEFSNINIFSPSYQ